MGYDTRYVLSANVDAATETKIALDLATLSSEFYVQDYVHDLIKKGYLTFADVIGTDEIHWYDHEAVLRKLSLQYPDVIFSLYVEGENRDDTWYKYFKNGKMQYAPGIMTFVDFSPALLK